MAAIVKNRVPERVLTLLQTLNAQQLVEVTHFMEFLKIKETQDPIEEPFLASIIREADPGVTLDQVRATQRPIAGNLSDVVIAGREERV